MRVLEVSQRERGGEHACSCRAGLLNGTHGEGTGLLEQGTRPAGEAGKGAGGPQGEREREVKKSFSFS